MNMNTGGDTGCRPILSAALAGGLIVLAGCNLTTRQAPELVFETQFSRFCAEVQGRIDKATRMAREGAFTRLQLQDLDKHEADKLRLCALPEGSLEAMAELSVADREIRRIIRAGAQ